MSIVDWIWYPLGIMFGMGSSRQDAAIERPPLVDWRHLVRVRSWNFWRVAPVLWQASPLDCLVLAATVLLGSGAAIAISVSTGLLVGAVPTAVHAGLGGQGARSLLLALAALAAAYLIQLMATPIQTIAQRHLRFRLIVVCQRRVIDVCLQPEAITHLEDPTLGDRIEAALGQGSFPPQQIADGLPPLLMSRIAGLGSALILFRFAWWAPLLIFAALLIFNRWMHTFSDLIYRSIQVASAGLRRAGYHRDLALDPRAAKELRLFGLAGWAVSAYADTWLADMRANWRQRGSLRGDSLFALAAGVLAMGIVLGALVLSFLSGAIGLSMLTIYGQAALGIRSLGPIGDNQTSWRLGGRNLLHLLDLEPGVPDSVSLASRGNRPPPRGAIAFEGVTFAYAGGLRVFDGFDLRIEEGQSVAIVGANGVGKTTLVKLLARLYEPDAGRITRGGVDLREIDLAAWRRQLAVIFQDFGRYPVSLRDNIAFGALDRGDPGEVERAAGRAGAAELAAEVPRGWDTRLTRSLTGGTDLSGGQWQRVALARALLAGRESGILILDEPTASLDVRQEAALFDRFLDLTSGMTTILISHRFSSVRRANRIVVVDHGRVVEDGSHDELLREGGVYGRLFALQAERFTEPER